MSFNPKDHKRIVRVLSIFSLIGLLISQLFLIDWLLPAEKFNSEIRDKFRGLERGFHKSAVGSRGPFLTHFRVYTIENKVFPIFEEDFNLFDKGDQVTIYYTRILNKPKRIFNNTSQYSSIPSTGLYSYFFWVIVSLFVASFLGLLFRNNIEIHSVMSILVLVLILIIFFAYLNLETA